MPHVLAIDDEQSILESLREILEYENYEVDIAREGEEGIDYFKNNKYDAVFLDIKMPKMDGLEVLDKLTEISSDVPVIMISGHGSIDTAVESIKKGAFDFIEKPLDLNRLLVTLRNALERKDLIKETQRLQKKVSKTYDIIGESESIRQVKEMIGKVAPTDASVLITGENGTGKELVARWLHEKSPRSDQPFVEVNCAAIPSELIESELFGHEKGAFTSAHKQRKGKFEQAHGGTIFLDEIGDMSLSAQSKVLKTLEEKKISRVGSDKVIEVDVRILAATNKTLKEEIRRNNFREDLYHRLSVIIIHVPSLDERKEDIPLLADHFNQLISQEYGIAKRTITDDAIKVLQQIKWTGNIREFRNVLERLIILCGEQITGEDVQKYAQPISG
ncbi:MAG: sigma-54 dependent transcriptional regulator [Bacteroidales bacterium]|nr:sigma-54-dependent Fis family transcriptional regulator [Bacteroidales bacterium]MBS3774938.1 sigma-54-dependent Fis family transcriptional regulator [Bacteroidales bacterium]